jgi:hypothetical protein
MDIIHPTSPFNASAHLLQYFNQSSRFRDEGHTNTDPTGYCIELFLALTRIHYLDYSTDWTSLRTWSLSRLIIALLRRNTFGSH